jgi:ABC-type lipoprotein export system ATPase subunit
MLQNGIFNGRELTKIYCKGDKSASLDGINFSIQKGEFGWQYRPSGSGKSNFAHILEAAA